MKSGRNWKPRASGAAIPYNRVERAENCKAGKL